VGSTIAKYRALFLEFGFYEHGNVTMEVVEAARCEVFEHTTHGHSEAGIADSLHTKGIGATLDVMEMLLAIKKEWCD
jgi:hypothetical protein